MSDDELGQLIGRSRQTVHRWRVSIVTHLPKVPAETVEDLRTIVAMLIEADCDGDTIRRFLHSRNAGLGNDRPLDGLRPGVGAFRRVERVTERFIAGIAPEPGQPLPTPSGAGQSH